MAHKARFRIRISGREIEIGTLEDLDEMVRLGRLGPGTEVYDPRNEQWGRVSEMAELRHRFADDPWDAWAEAEHTDPDFVWPELGASAAESEAVTAPPTPAPASSAASAPEPEESTTDAPTDTSGGAGDEEWRWLGSGGAASQHDADPLTEDASDPPSREALFDPDLPVDAPDPEEEPTAPPDAPLPSDDSAPGKVITVVPPPIGPPMLEDPTRSPSDRLGSPLVGPAGKVIEFPTDKLTPKQRRRSKPNAGPHALQEHYEDIPVMQPEPKEPPLVRLSVVLGALTVGFIGLAWWIWYVEAVSTPPSVAGGHFKLPDVEQNEVADVESPARNRIAALEATMAETLPDEVRSVASESEFENAILSEMVMLGVDAIEVDASVLSWTTPADSVRRPQVVEFRVRITPQDLQPSQQELAAVAMVIGRYIEHYSLVVTRFDLVVEIENTTPRTVPMDAMRAQRLASGRISLADYFRVQ